MSGGHFDYAQYQICEMADSVGQLILINGVKDEGGDIPHSFNDEVINEFKIGLNHLRMASIYTQRIDWLVSGDDGETEFIKRLKEDLANYEKS